MWKKLLELCKKGLQGERGIRVIVILGLVGLAFILLSGFLPDEKQSAENKTETGIEEDANAQTQAYCRDMEIQLKSILEQVEGVGTCQVMLTASGTSETVYAQDQTAQEEDTKRQSQQKCVIVSDDAGERALVQQVVSPRISGVIVVCSGATSSVVQERVTCAVQAVLELPANRVYVVPAQV